MNYVIMLDGNKLPQNHVPFSRTMLDQTIERLQVINGHLKRLPELHVTPEVGLIDEIIHIQVTGLKPYQNVTIEASVAENNARFVSWATYKADKKGEIYLSRDPALSGTYSGIEPMGLFWSMKSQTEGKRMIKKRADTARIVKIKAKPNSETSGTECPCLEKTIERWYKSINVQRIPVKEGKLRGTVFIPEGKGPFPAVIDMFGGLVDLVESRAALLASRGFASFALSYMFMDDLPKVATEVNLQYFLDAVDWFSQQPYVDADRMGMLGLCFGGGLSLWTAAHEPKIKAVVNINGMPFFHCQLQKNDVPTPYQGIVKTDAEILKDGVSMKGIFSVPDNNFIPAWQYGSKILVLIGEDDLMSSPHWHAKYLEACPAEFRSNIEMVRYPGAGHLIEPPYTPLNRLIPVSFGEIERFDAVNSTFLLCGGETKLHAKAQEQAWDKILNFLRTNL
ncbi:hypothetical protein CHS0354_002514 [Potamilus streckersoni]|uniref:Uncharacterized protein n=1 Tax=Potamilus streckersoni TaxID=2493646 RepID=A0AAE0SRL0_9BIVA|nr:hypothetical protein CHS0354_002514 [Potamilus streckersoni]